jgi:hypothetical protein
LVYFTAIGNILWPFGIFYGHLVYFVVIWYIFALLGILYQINLATLAVAAVFATSADKHSFLNSLVYWTLEQKRRNCCANKARLA